MASPIWEGTFSSSAFSSRDIDILKEKIYLKIDKNFSTAFYRIEYFIRTDSNGRQIPLLFHAKDYKGDFKVWVDNQEVKLLDIPGEYKTTANSPFTNFSNSFRQPSRNGEPETVEIYWQKNAGIVYALNDLKYFETDLSKGEHVIRVEYTANVWTDKSDWVKEYSFRYSLSPAKHWKSFGSLEIILDASDFNSALTTNLGQPTNGRLDSISVWNFSKLPSDYFEMIYKPEISAFAKTLIAISPFGLTLIFALFIALLHLISIKKYRKSQPTRKYSWVVIVGSLIIPFFILISYMVSFGIIDSVIGDEAGRYHGYTFLVIGLYPLLMPVYWTIMWLADKKIKERINNVL
jgi:hypothetical protein